MKIDTDAPLKAQKEILISGSIENVWSALTVIDRWAEWQPDVTFAKLDGKLEKGTVFRWKAKGLNITSVIQLLEPIRSIGWTGNSLGMKAIHVWSLEQRNDGTFVKTQESLSGWFPRILKLFDPEFLEKSLVSSLQILKSHVEEM
ncbi:MAG: SRPBCC family protein [Anaerolineales bacterium]|jgi:uncharacterized protein YndB with AHSA1/START domain